MSNITQSGPKGYEYQYEISLLVALQQLETSNIELYIEAVGIEDTYIRMEKNGTVQNIEIQVKSEKNLLTLKTLTKWLYHFEASSSEENLLKKVIYGSVALFITQSRCSDNVYHFKKDIPNINKHTNPSYTKNSQWTKDFLKYLGTNEFSKKTTILAQKRNELCQNQKLYFSSNKRLNDVFKNVIIWEEITHSKLSYEIEIILNQKFNIPQSRCSDVRRKLYEYVLNGRDTGNNIIPKLKLIIQQYQPGRPQLYIDQYIERNKENDFIIELSNKNLLLLTGNSFCGKTSTAKKIAAHFFDNGFNYKIANDIQVLQEFFSQNIQEDKIAILEDVWGHIEADASSPRIKRRVEQLSNNLPNHHKLILTSRIEILKKAFPNQSKINGFSWHNLTINDNKALVQFWQNFTANRRFPLEMIELVKQNLLDTNQKHQLQIGQLEHLSNQDIEDLKGKTFDELVHISRQQSEEVANHLRNKNPNAADLLSVLALCANTIQGVKLEDLTYILLGDDMYYSISIKEPISFSFDNIDKEGTNKYFQYSKDYSLTENYSNLLDLLEERGFITITNEKVIFTHPNYYEAGRYLFCKSTNRKQQQFFAFYKRALGCINSSTTFLAASQLDILINLIGKNRKPYLPQLFQIAEWLYQSKYPATKDTSLIFRIKQIEELSISQHETLLGEIRNADNYIERI